MREARRFGRSGLATPHYLASAAGAEVLAAGGNAVDAIVAANLALGVVAPYFCGFGGDLFAIVWDGRTVHGYQSAGRSAATTSLDEVRRACGDEMPTFGPHTVTVPGAVRGWFDLLEQFGTRSFSELSERAVVLARDGVPLTARGAASLELVRLLHERDPWSAELVATYSAERTRAGARLHQPALARTIELLGTDGADAFYRGPVASAIAETVRRYGGSLAAGDLAAHEAAWVEPLRAEVFGHELCELPPPTQGVAALEALAIAQHLPIAELAAGDPAREHLLVEAVKLALVDRDRHVGDPDTMTVDPRSLFDPGRASGLARAIEPGRATERPVVPAADGGTAYLCAADANGLAVSLIQSNFTAIGSGIHVSEWGLNLQNRGSSFRLDPDHVNALAPSKLPMHTLIPALVLRDGRPTHVFGTMGGHTQAQVHLQVLTRILLDGEEIQRAIAAPRWSVDPGSWVVGAERRLGADWVSAMRGRGHEVELRRSFDDGMGHAHAIAIEETSLAVATDPRAEGAALGE